MAKESENYLTGYMILMCTMIWAIQTRELILLGQHLEVKKFHILDGVALDVFLLTPVSVISSFLN